MKSVGERCMAISAVGCAGDTITDIISPSGFSDGEINV